jgi:hypothetical protein
MHSRELPARDTARANDVRTSACPRASTRGACLAVGSLGCAAPPWPRWAGPDRASRLRPGWRARDQHPRSGWRIPSGTEHARTDGPVARAPAPRATLRRHDAAALARLPVNQTPVPGRRPLASHHPAEPVTNAGEWPRPLSRRSHGSSVSCLVRRDSGDRSGAGPSPGPAPWPPSGCGVVRPRTSRARR